MANSKSLLYLWYSNNHNMETVESERATLTSAIDIKLFGNLVFIRPQIWELLNEKEKSYV